MAGGAASLMFGRGDEFQLSVSNVQSAPSMRGVTDSDLPHR
jgi:hypothetical protein